MQAKWIKLDIVLNHESTEASSQGEIFYDLPINERARYCNNAFIIENFNI